MGVVARRQSLSPGPVLREGHPRRGTVPGELRRRIPPPPGRPDPRGPALGVGLHHGTSDEGPSPARPGAGPEIDLVGQRRRGGTGVGLPVQPPRGAGDGGQPGPGRQHHGRIDDLRRRVRSRLGGRHQRHQQQLGLRLRQLSAVQDRCRGLPGRPHDRRRARRHTPEHLRRGQLLLRPVPHLRLGAAARPHRPRRAQRNDPTADRGAVAADRRVRHHGAGPSPRRDPHPTAGLPEPDPGAGDRGAGDDDSRPGHDSHHGLHHQRHTRRDRHRDGDARRTRPVGPSGLRCLLRRPRLPCRRRRRRLPRRRVLRRQPPPSARSQAPRRARARRRRQGRRRIRLRPRRARRR